MNIKEQTTPEVKPVVTEADVVAFIVEEKVNEFLLSYLGKPVNGRPIHHVSIGASCYIGSEEKGERWITAYVQAADDEYE